MDGQPKDSGGGGFDLGFGFGFDPRTRIERPGGGGRVKRWVLHGGHGEGPGTASSTTGPHLGRLRDRDAD